MTITTGERRRYVLPRLLVGAALAVPGLVAAGRLVLLLSVLAAAYGAGWLVDRRRARTGQARPAGASRRPDERDRARTRTREGGDRR